MFSEELAIMDRNMEKYMVDEMKSTIKEHESTIKERDSTIREQNSLIQMLIQQNQELQARLDAILAQVASQQT